jgi:hypothetical protein
MHVLDCVFSFSSSSFLFLTYTLSLIDDNDSSEIKIFLNVKENFFREILSKIKRIMSGCEGKFLNDCTA